MPISDLQLGPARAQHESRPHRKALVQGVPDPAHGLTPSLAHEMAADALMSGAPAGAWMQGGICALDKQARRA